MHAHNPVDWYPWGNEAFDKATRENKLVIVSIGYAACHWCHVMEKECFTDPVIADLMNKHFISVKVDREERPDVDEVYMSAIQLTGGRGGWPLNAFALPDGRPLYAVTYLPPAQWQDLLLKLNEFYNKAPGKADEQALQIEEGMRSSEFTAPEYLQSGWPQDIFNEIFERWLPYMDIEKGGYLNAPKFPLPVSWEYFLQYYVVSKDKKAFEAISATLDHMGRGGIFDQIGGGFSRYSVDVEWKVPHFEKMLYDNAQLVSLYSHVFQVTGCEYYAEIVRTTINFVNRELTSPEGAFYTSLDADSEGVEGTYYSWTTSQIDVILGKNSAIMKDFFSMTKDGNWENGKNILFSEFSNEEFSKKHGIELSLWNEIYNGSCAELLTIRNARPKPPLDDKILTSWNALMIKSLTDAFLALGNNEYLERAVENARYLMKNAYMPDGSLQRNLKKGKTIIPGFLDDYAYLAEAWLALYKATFNNSWLTEAAQIISMAIGLFEEPVSGLFFYTPAGHTQFAVRKKIIQDNVLPSPTAIMGKVMLLAGIYLGNEDLLIRSEKLCKAVIPSLVTGGPYMSGWSSIILNYARGPKEITIFGSESGEWRTKLSRLYLPDVIIFGAELNINREANDIEKHAEQTYAIICSGKQCGLPIYTFNELLNSINP